jgi:hypothetical protein
MGCDRFHAPGKELRRTHFRGGWVGPGASIDVVEKNLPLSGIELQLFGRSARRYTDWAIIHMGLLLRKVAYTRYDAPRSAKQMDVTGH